MLEKRLKKNLYILIFLNLSLLLFAVAYTVYFKLSEGSDYAIECVFKKTFGIYCPGCGATRALYNLLSFNLLKSFILYPPVLISALIIFDYDARLFITLVKKNTSITDRFKYYTFLLIPISIILTFVIRNILFIFFKIDTVGDFI